MTALLKEYSDSLCPSSAAALGSQTQIVDVDLRPTPIDANAATPDVNQLKRKAA